MSVEVSMKAASGRLLLSVALALIAVFSSSRALAQEPAPEDVIRTNTDLVVLDAQVINKKTAQPVGGLKREDFELYENGARQQITYFSQDELPLSILLLLDVSGSVRPIVNQIGDGALNALQRLKPQDEVAVMAFGTYSKLIQGFTKDRPLIAQKIQEASMDYGVGRGTFLDEALARAASEMTKATNPVSRRVILVVTDNVAFTQKNIVRRTMTDLLESGTVVYGLIVRAAFGKVFNVMTFGQVHGLNPYAEETGGEIINADKKEVDEKLSEMIVHLRTRYSIGYVPTNTKEDSILRKIDLKVTPAAAGKENLAVKTKRGYYFRRRAD